MQRCADLLVDEGVLVMNMIASIEGEGSPFLASQYLTLREVFSQVEVYAVNDRAVEPGAPRNVAIIATKSTSFDLRRRLDDINPKLASRRITLDTEQGIVLTDDFAPVDQMLMSVNR
jgi:transcription elongation factor